MFNHIAAVALRFMISKAWIISAIFLLFLNCYWFNQKILLHFIITFNLWIDIYMPIFFLNDNTQLWRKYSSSFCSSLTSPPPIHYFNVVLSVLYNCIILRIRKLSGRKNCPKPSEKYKWHFIFFNYVFIAQCTIHFNCFTVISFSIHLIFSLCVYFGYSYSSPLSIVFASAYHI